MIKVRRQYTYECDICGRQEIREYSAESEAHIFPNLELPEEWIKVSTGFFRHDYYCTKCATKISKFIMRIKRGEE